MIEFKTEQGKQFYENWAKDLNTPISGQILYVLGQATVVNNFMHHHEFQADLIELAESMMEELEVKGDKKD